jgi:hypothetical protein
VEQDFAMRAGESDIVTEMAPRPYFYRLPHFEENDLSRNSHPFTECSGGARIAALFQRQGRHVWGSYVGATKMLVAIAAPPDSKGLTRSGELRRDQGEKRGWPGQGR